MFVNIFVLLYNFNMKFKKVKFDDISPQTFEHYNDIKVIVFDFDGTLYKNIDWTGYDKHVLKGIRKYFSELTDSQYEQMLVKHNVQEDTVTEDLARLFRDEKGSTELYVEYMDSLKFEGDFSNAKIFSEELLSQLSKKVKLFVLSNSSVPNIKFVCNKINLNLNAITKIYSNRFDVDDLSKTKRLKELIAELDVIPSQVLMVGDSIVNDLIPARKLGLKTLHVVD